jgi:hypothetical protein
MSTDEEFLKRARQTLDRAATDIDELTAARLRAARLRALDAAATTPRWRPAWLTVAGSAVAAGLVAIVVGTLWFAVPTPHAPMPVADADDFELLTMAENPDFFEELDFYEWLTDHDDA